MKMDTAVQSSDGNQPNLAPLALDATVVNGIVASMFTGKTMGVKLDLQSLVLELNEQVDQLRSGDKSKTETILFAQALTLNAIFLEMSRRAALNMGQHLDATEAYMRMALKAQNQVRLTLETINNMRNPPMVIAKQANISAGPQQVNNVLVDTANLQNMQNQLSGVADELRSDTRASSTQG
jgi:hypothetical protein